MSLTLHRKVLADEARGWSGYAQVADYGVMVSRPWEHRAQQATPSQDLRAGRGLSLPGDAG